MSIMKVTLSIFSAIVLALGVSACGIFEDRYRYECQDPQNWNSENCKPPLCTGYCTVDLLGFDQNEGMEEISEISEEPQEETTSDILEEPKSGSEPENVDSINKMVSELSEGN